MQGHTRRKDPATLSGSNSKGEAGKKFLPRDANHSVIGKKNKQPVTPARPASGEQGRLAPPA